MQGMIFTNLADMVTDTFGIAEWNTILKTVAPKSDGVYTSGQQYDDAELFALVACIADRNHIEINALIEQFGEYLFPHLFANSPANVTSITSLDAFLDILDGVIHKEVKRLHPDAYLPSFTILARDQHSTLVRYQSKRHLWVLAIGLLKGAARHFSQSIEVDHELCTHDGEPACNLRITYHV